MKKLYYEIIETPEFGRGVYAYVGLFKGEIIFDAELLVLSPEDTKVVNTTDLKYYTFKYDETRDCLVLGDGEIFNHSDEPNVAYTLVEHEGRKIMRFTTLRDIKDGEQMFIDYNADTEVDVSEYMGKNLLDTAEPKIGGKYTAIVDRPMEADIVHGEVVHVIGEVGKNTLMYKDEDGVEWFCTRAKFLDFFKKAGV